MPSLLEASAHISEGLGGLLAVPSSRGLANVSHLVGPIASLISSPPSWAGKSIVLCRPTGNPSVLRGLLAVPQLNPDRSKISTATGPGTQIKGMRLANIAFGRWWACLPVVVESFDRQLSKSTWDRPGAIKRPVGKWMRRTWCKGTLSWYSQDCLGYNVSDEVRLGVLKSL
ncbi:hypothetical protein CKAH01_05915 [Colletotrichum kahawae]|uniref:Uncharacterized protein n=1 Tax=Colletotrichum kahawae TaxID=34407 RepID=A0AAE0D4J2_COLKA|nr:hypothetical protein CKAH01_05915 [Colletotrichum kahawae]